MECQAIQIVVVRLSRVRIALRAALQSPDFTSTIPNTPNITFTPQYNHTSPFPSLTTSNTSIVSSSESQTHPKHLKPKAKLPPQNPGRRSRRSSLGPRPVNARVASASSNSPARNEKLHPQQQQRPASQSHESRLAHPHGTAERRSPDKLTDLQPLENSDQNGPGFHV